MNSEVIAKVPGTSRVIRRFPSGRLVDVGVDGHVYVLSPAEAASLDEYLYGPAEEPVQCCSICDAPGHGYPGGGPCPLEETGWMEAEMDRLRFGEF